MFIRRDGCLGYGQHENKHLSQVETFYLQSLLGQDLCSCERAKIEAELLDRSSKLGPGGNRFARALNPASLKASSPAVSRNTPFEILDVTFLPPSEDSITADCGVVVALADIRCAGLVVRDCRLIRDHQGRYRL